MSELAVVWNYTYDELITAGAVGNTALPDIIRRPNRQPAERKTGDGYFDPSWISPEFTGKFTGTNPDIAMLTPAIPTSQFSGFSAFMLAAAADGLVGTSSLVIRIGDAVSGDNIDLTKNYKDIEPAYPMVITAWDGLRPAKSYAAQTLIPGGGSSYIWGLEGNARIIMPPFLQLGIILAGDETDALVRTVVYANYL
jgi:hypothetical protein